MRLSRFFCVGIVLAGGLHVAIAQQSVAGWGLPQLMQSMAQVRSASAQFAERQSVPMLDAPLMTYGTLRYVAPDYVRKITTAPAPEDFLLDHGEVTLSGGPDHQTHRFSVAQAPQIGGLVEGIRATLAGDLPALQLVYSVRLSGNEAGWQLTLQPRDPGVSRFVKWIIILGHQNQIDAVDTASSNGSHSEMGITLVRRDAP